MEGTKFQKSVWKELQNIPYGETRTYKEAAAAIGNEKVDGSAGAFSNIFNQLNLDIPGGFQDINPLLFITIGEILGDIMSGNMPYNEANSVSNFFLLLGQILEAWSAQIQYAEIGPGRYYSPLYKNIENPYCYAEDFTKEIKELE